MIAQNSFLDMLNVQVPGVFANEPSGTIDAGFLGNLQGLWCNMMATNGPLIPLVAGAALAVFGVLFILDEGNSYMSTLLRIMIGIALLVFIPGILSTGFGIDMGCDAAAV